VADKEVIIYGAGMSGMVAAINLAGEGRKVIIHDMEEGYGGTRLYNPSTHVTPMDVRRTCDYIGIDVSPVFHLVEDCPLYFHDTKVPLPLDELQAVERGNRPGSLDTLLYQECQKLGVEFNFSSPLTKELIPKLPPGTIVACGLVPKAYDMVGVPYIPWNGWVSRGEADFTNRAWMWFDESIAEYGYISSVNNYYFNLLFSFGAHPRDDALPRYKDWMKRIWGMEHDNWEYRGGAVPLATPDNCKLFRKGLIMCGTISGAMDPFMGFGISGALVTGKIAAQAVSDPAGAQSQFDHFMRQYRRVFYAKVVWRRVVRPYVKTLERAVKLVGLKRAGQLVMPRSRAKLPVPVLYTIPGFGHLNTERV